MFRIYSFLSVLSGLILLSDTVTAQNTVEKDLSSSFSQHGVKGCFILYNTESDTWIEYNRLSCDSGYIPASTFKIPHALIALEEEVVTDTNQVIKWDGHEWFITTWNQDQTLKTSLKYSCVWVYTGFAQQMPIDTYYRYVRDFDYGNKDLRGPSDRFWLAGAFRISARQQVEFLRRFYNYNLPVSKRSVDLVKGCIVLERTPAYILSGKTGSGMLSDTDYIMWLVGYVEKEGHTYFYAMNFRSNDWEKTAPLRYDIAKEILRELKIL
ncbi:MAG TPA: penicillin-binding transpeptidase domain-containing protein [Bacteroidales bacterium]|nr:penicillin-binding transpeptidase domain-containing protein [Bacteroidales bacterium]